jgi:hypothetical protein
MRSSGPQLDPHHLALYSLSFFDFVLLILCPLSSVRPYLDQAHLAVTNFELLAPGLTGVNVDRKQIHTAPRKPVSAVRTSDFDVAQSIFTFWTISSPPLILFAIELLPAYPALGDHL